MNTPIHQCIFVESQKSYLDGHVVDIQTEGDALVEGQLRLSSAVDVHGLFRLDVTFLVVYTGFNHTVTDGLDRQRWSHASPHY